MMEYKTKDLEQIVDAHFKDCAAEIRAERDNLIKEFEERRKEMRGDLATDQLLNALAIVARLDGPLAENRKMLLDGLLKPLRSS